MTSDLGAAAPRDQSGSAATRGDDAEVARLKTERDADVASPADKQRGRRGSTPRRVFVGLFVVLFAILVPITVTAAWAHRSVLDNGAWDRTVDPIASNPAVTAAVSRQVTDQLYTALNPEAIIADALPPKAAFLAAPITNGTKGYVQTAVNNVLQSSQFQKLWAQASHVAHAQVVSALRGDGKLLQTTNGVVVINLVPLLNDALQNMQGFASSVVGKPVTLPTITSDELPAAACQKIATALNRPLPATCGQIPLFRGNQLSTARRVVRIFDRAVLALLIVTPLIALVALWVSRTRRRTLLQLTIGSMLGLVIVRRSTMWMDNKLISTGRPENKDARSAIVHQVLSGFFDLTLWMLVGGLVIVAIALLTGPYRWAVKARGHIAAAAHTTARLARAAMNPEPSGSVGDQSAVLWVRSHLDLLRVSGVVAAVLLLLAFDINAWGLLVIVALLAVYELWLYRLRPPRSVTLPPDAPPPTSA